MELTNDWYKDAVVYQLYTRSFADSNGDGIGDFGGVLEKLPYLEDLGVDVLWLSPFCNSPNDDNGYDVSDYYSIHPEFGTMSDFDRLVSQAHKRGMKIMMDLVLNHSSDEHPWFVESRTSRNNPKRDWYIWADPAPGPGQGYEELAFTQAGRGYGGRAKGPVIPGVNTGYLPNNWDSYFGGKAWEFDPTTGQYYLHIFSTKQPDLNWANPELRQEMARIAQFWIDRGVQAFRLDAIHHIGKPQALPDVPPSDDPWHINLYKNTQETHRYLQELNSAVFEPAGVYTVGETGGTTPRSARLYVDRDRRELSSIFHFDHVHLKDPHDASQLKNALQTWYQELSDQGWDAQFFSNHDLPRQLTAFGDDRWLRGKSAKAIGTVLLTAWGTPYLYQGEEIGMTNCYFPSMDMYRDRHALRGYHDGIAAGEDRELVIANFQRRNRDNSRTPMQWSAQTNGGFCPPHVEPWIPLADNYPWINVEAETQWTIDSEPSYGPGGVQGPGGILSWYRELIALRRERAGLRRGDFQLVDCGHRSILGYQRGAVQDVDSRRYTVLVNWSGTTVEGHISLPLHSMELLMSNYGHEGSAKQQSAAADFAAALGASNSEAQQPAPEEFRGEQLLLKPWEVRIYSS